jgi:cytochrome oxidase Cu insertion factor (SCO1/SenC/PrrC family)
MRRYGQRRARWRLLSILSFCLICAWAVSILADDTPTPPPGLTAVSQPTPIPSFSLPSVDGKTVDATSLAGKVAVVRFWATW